MEGGERQVSFKDGEVAIVRVDPFNRVTGMLFPFMLRRMMEFAQIHIPEMNPEAQVRDHARRACEGDPNLLLLAFLAPDGRLIGHAVSIIQEDYGKKWLFVTQCKVDEPGGDAVGRAIQMSKDFGRERGAMMLLHITKRSDGAWARAYGFKTMRHLMWMPLNDEATPEPVAVREEREAE